MRSVIREKSVLHRGMLSSEELSASAEEKQGGWLEAGMS